MVPARWEEVAKALMKEKDGAAPGSATTDEKNGSKKAGVRRVNS